MNSLLFSPKCAALLALPLLLSGAALAQQTKQTRDTGTFEAVQAGGAVNVFLKQGPQTAVVVEAPKEALSYITTTVRGGVLEIRREEGMSQTLRNLLNTKGNHVNIYITAPRLTAITASGASDVMGESELAADAFSIRASGASDVVLKLNVKALTVEASGSSDVKLTGQAERQQVQLSGSSDYLASGLQGRQATVTASGSSDAYLAVSETLKAQSSGSSDIINKGTARVSR
ncbi:head GIN domain-containing protein [Hymenobacter weizhouensis]|uniref:head GIN domain-containing protein n=1 Tax=Hymenobacter sp. YIM 151500-1 TaxID=2987689 RepID=UPI002226363F|nr:head GIN domain-containing protein [Hymenobacter sp. YIM 151500-1]UYZ64264.1 DUF2807 domain-containing protein [Hymenobacter sp. YIM 151500-1]